MNRYPYSKAWCSHNILSVGYIRSHTWSVWSVSPFLLPNLSAQKIYMLSQSSSCKDSRGSPPVGSLQLIILKKFRLWNIVWTLHLTLNYWSYLALSNLYILLKSFDYWKSSTLKKEKRLLGNVLKIVLGCQLNVSLSTPIK